MPLWKSKLRAFGTHLGISFIIFLGLLYFIVFEWYPPPFFSTDGGWQGIRIIAAVDLVLGPLLTLIVFKPGKKGLKFDLSMIALAQLGALTWGIWAVYNERPVAVVFAEDAFTPVPAYLMAEHGMKARELNRFGEDFPVTIYSDLPTEDINKMQALRKRSMREKTPLYLYTEYYRPMDRQFIAKVNEHAMDMDLYMQVNKKAAPIFARFQQDYTDRLAELNFFRLHARHARRIIAADRETLTFVETLAIKPPDPNQEVKMDRLRRERNRASGDTQSGK